MDREEAGLSRQKWSGRRARHAHRGSSGRPTSLSIGTGTGPPGMQKAFSTPITARIESFPIRQPMAKASVRLVLRRRITGPAERVPIDAGLWDPDTNTPTRLEERSHVTLRLACLRDGAVMPYAGDIDPLLGLGAVGGVRGAVPGSRPARCQLDWKSRSTLPRRNGGSGSGTYLSWCWPCYNRKGMGIAWRHAAESGTVVMARYDVRTGLSWPEARPASAG